MEQEQHSNRGRKFLFIAIGIAAVGTAGYFGYEYYQKHKNQNNTNSDDFTANDNNSSNYNNDSLPANNSNNNLPASNTPTSSDFPLQQGSRGAKVKALQRALISKYGAKVLPKYGADGDWGNEMNEAMQKENLPTTIDESTYNLIVKGNAPASDSLAQTLVRAAITRNFNSVIDSLKQMRNTDDYASVSSQFKLYRVNGVHQTLVNGLLNSFVPEEQKQQIRLEFLRMGLKYDGNKWALSGIEKQLLITTQPATVYVSNRKKVNVPAEVVLGTALQHKDGFILFENNQQHFAVDASQVRYF